MIRILKLFAASYLRLGERKRSENVSFPYFSRPKNSSLHPMCYLPRTCNNPEGGRRTTVWCSLRTTNMSGSDAFCREEFRADGGGGKETLGNHFCNSQESRGFVGSYILQFPSAADCCTQVRKTGGNKSPREDGNFVGNREGRIFSSSSSTFSKSRISVLFFLPPNQPRPDPSPLFLSEEFGRRGLEEEGGNI